MTSPILSYLGYYKQKLGVRYTINLVEGMTRTNRGFSVKEEDVARKQRNT